MRMTLIPSYPQLVELLGKGLEGLLGVFKEGLKYCVPLGLSGENGWESLGMLQVLNRWPSLSLLMRREQAVSGEKQKLET